jgi:hypothetical protein
VGFTPQFITHLLIDFPLSLKSAPQAQAHGAMQIHNIIKTPKVDYGLFRAHALSRSCII